MTSKSSSMLEKLRNRAAPVPDDDGKSVVIPLDKIRFDSAQPRTDFHHPDGHVTKDDEASLDELVESIKENGLIHPITVESVGDGSYRIVVGERRARAFLKLGRTTISAKIRDDLQNPKTRLIYQMAENVNRKGLKDSDTANSIRVLMEGTADVEPMTQTQIAKALGKSEGWVSRYVKYLDEELQRLWVRTGIADRVENLYRLSVLPVPVQVEIQRRVQLPEDDPDFLAKPLHRSIIDEFAREVKAAKKADTTRLTITPATATQAPSPQHSGVFKDVSPAADQQLSSVVSAPVGTTADNGLPTDPVARAFAEMAAQGHEAPTAPQQQKAEEETPSSGSTTNSRYQLPESHRAMILSQAGVTLNKPTQKAPSPSPAQPPVSVRARMASLQALLEKLEPEDQAALVGMEVSILLPGPLADRIAQTLTGEMVDPGEVPAVVQTELLKLQ